MAEQLPSGRWAATQNRGAATVTRIFDTEEEALQFDNPDETT